MALVNHETREVTFKIVYAGTPVSGKTTNLAYIHSRIGPTQRGDMVSLATSTDRTLFFDFVPINTVMINGYMTKFMLYTVPGQVYYNATRQLVLRGADGVVFVADSQLDRLDENIESARTLAKNLRDNGMSLENLPLVLQYNKRDLPNAAPLNYLDYVLNSGPTPFASFESVANQGVNVFATLNAVSQLVLQRFHTMTSSIQSAPPVRPAAEQREMAAAG
ncbi:MAG: GTP-binding protein [Verrucomicrobiales bacterium]